jgi:hypothetical protein
LLEKKPVYKNLALLSLQCRYQGYNQGHGNIKNTARKVCGDVVPGYRGENDGNIPDTEKTLMKECSGLGDLVVRIARPEEKKVKEESRIHEETLMF